MKSIYFAGPLFTKAQAEREERVKAKLRELGFDVHSPKEDSNITGTKASMVDRKATFDSNVSNIDRVDIIFALMDGKHAICDEEDTNGRPINAIDTGTLFEVGYAYCLRQKYGTKPLIIYYSETLKKEQFNLMLAQSCDMLITDERDEAGNLIETAFERLKYLPEWIETDTKIEYNGEIE